MDDHRQLMQLSTSSRVATADTSDVAVEPGAQEPDLRDLLELSLEALLRHFRRE